MKNFLAISLLLASLSGLLKANAQENLPAIDFKNIDFESAKVLAKQSGKGIFMDVFAVWCIPCKQFEKTVFTDKEVGEKFNEWFINLKVDAEKEEGKKLAKIYSVGGYPTGIFINSDGVLLSKFEGVLTKATFLIYGENALKMKSDPQGYENALSAYRANSKDLQSIRNLIQKSILSGNQIPVEAMECYFEKPDSKIVIQDTALLRLWVNSTPTVIAGKSTYSYFLNQHEFVKRNLQLSDEFLRIFFYNSLQNSVQKATVNKDRNLLNEVLELNQHLPSTLKQVENIDYEMDYYSETKEFELYFEKVNSYCHAHFDKINSKNLKAAAAQELAARLNNFAWNYFSYANKKEELTYAESLMKKCIQLDSNFAAWYDTYAGIVYKLGELERALEIETKAIHLSAEKPAEQSIYQRKIERMKKGEKIWLPEQY